MRYGVVLLGAALAVAGSGNVLPVAGDAGAARAVVEDMWRRYRDVPSEFEALEILVVAAPKDGEYSVAEAQALLDGKRPGVIHKRAERHTLYAADGADKIRVRFSLPAEDADTTFLVHRAADGQDHQWLYLPATRRVRRIPVSSSQTFVGTDFIYEDVRALSGERTERFDYEMLAEGSDDGRPCHVVRATPKPGTDSSYGSRTMWIERETIFPLRVEYYGRGGKLWKVMRNRGVAPVGGKTHRAELVEMRDVQVNETTLIWSKQRRIGESIPSHVFSSDAME